MSLDSSSRYSEPVARRGVEEAKQDWDGQGKATSAFLRIVMARSKQKIIGLEYVKHVMKLHVWTALGRDAIEIKPPPGG